MSFLKRLFGLGADQTAADESREHKGFVITAAPLADGGQWRLAGTISKEIDGVRREHRFIRADVFADRADAVRLALKKGELIIDQSGEAIFG